MFKNYLKIAFRNIWKNKIFSLINVLGLAVGIAVCLLIVMYIHSERSYDAFFPNADRIYRMALERRYPDRTNSYAIIPHSVGDAVQKEAPEVAQCLHLYSNGGQGNLLVRLGEKVFEEGEVILADSNFFSVFQLPLLQGNAATALGKPNAVVLPVSTALKYFGTTDVLNKMLQSDLGDLLVTGVCEDVPENAHFTFDLLISAAILPGNRQLNYTGFDSYVYFLLHPHTSPQALEAKFPKVVEKYVAGDIERHFGVSFQQFQKSGNGYRYFLQPLRSIHLQSDLEAELKPAGSLASVYIFSVIAVFILLIACANFVNLATARSVERAKEVGIRKTFGSERQFIVLQFLLESVIISVCSFMLACGCMALCLPLFNSLTGKELSLSFLLQPLTWIVFCGVSVGIGLLAGFYPALVLSSYQPLAVLKGRFTHNKQGRGLRNALVVVQFAVSIVLIASTIVVYIQMQFMQGEKLGFQKDHVITIQRTDLLQDKSLTFRTEVEKMAGVESVARVSSMPGNQNFFGMSVTREGSREPLTGRGLVVDEHILSALRLTLVQGRGFSKQFPSDSLAILLNEKAVAELGLKNPIGARLTSPDAFLNQAGGEQPTIFTVIGVVKDFHFQSLHQKINPLIFLNVEKFGGASPFMAIRIRANEFQHTLTSIENTWQKLMPQQPFHYSFLDQDLAALYQAEQRSQRVFSLFSVLAIFIACMGLLGLAAYTTQQRTKEIGIRKVLGASENQIVALLSWDFLKLVGIAFLLAVPLGWWMMSRWLENFAYHISLSGWIFMAAGILAACIALMTISFQAIKAAVANPIKSLRTE